MTNDVTERYAQPLTFPNGATIKNRFLMAPMTNKMSFFDGVITENELNYYRIRSKEAGAIITAAANVSEGGKGWEGELGVYDDRHIPGLAQLASAIKTNGTKAILQIFHGGRMTNASVLRGVQPVSASAIKAERPTAEEPRALEENEIEQILEDFKDATIRAIKAGFDGVEIHGANTYLIQQFFSPHSNRREDKWGGSVEKRFTFIKELVEKVTDAVKSESKTPFIVGYRFSPEEYETPGIRFKDTLYLVDQLADMPIDYLHVSLGKFNQVSQSTDFQDKPMIAYLHDYINGRVPFISVGDVRNGTDAKEALTHSDAIALGRVILADPHIVNKILTGREDLIRYTVSSEEREELFLANGVWQFMQNMMADRLG